jgi:transcriptional regulator GlxA family with amidase domain
MNRDDGSLDSNDVAVRRAARYLRAHATEHVSMRKACRELAVNERTLVRRFRAVLGMTPLTYLQSQRVARARDLLQRTTLPLERIVTECGYEDVSSFRKLFNRHVGMTPREYRSRFATAAQ